MILKSIIFLTTTVLITSCSEGVNIENTLNAFKNSTISIEQYVAVKNFTKAAQRKKEGSYKLFLDRSRVSDAILSNELKNSDAIKVKLQETKNTIVIQQYFRTYLDKTVTREAVKKYYAEHKNEFEGVAKSLPKIYSDINYKLRLSARTKEYQRLLSVK